MHKSESMWFSAIGLYLLFGLVTGANAAQGSLTQYINQIASTQTVKAYLSTNPHTGIDCSFTATSISNVEQLKKILQRAHLNEVPALESHLPVIGLRLEFALSNGNVVELVFGKEYYGEELVDGMVKDTSKKYPVYFLADRSIYRDIYSWAKQNGLEMEPYYSYASKSNPFMCESWKVERGLSEAQFRSCLASRDLDIERRMGRCEAIKHRNYYQTSAKQTCEAVSIHRSVPDLCPTGWK